MNNARTCKLNQKLTFQAQSPIFYFPTENSRPAPCHKGTHENHVSSGVPLPSTRRHVSLFPRTSYKSRSDINRGVDTQYQPFFIIHIDLSTWNEPIKRIVETSKLGGINSTILNFTGVKVLVGPTEVKLGLTS